MSWLKCQGICVAQLYKYKISKKPFQCVSNVAFACYAIRSTSCQTAHRQTGIYPARQIHVYLQFVPHLNLFMNIVSSDGSSLCYLYLSAGRPLFEISPSPFHGVTKTATPLHNQWSSGQLKANHAIHNSIQHKQKQWHVLERPLVIFGFLFI